MSKANRKSAVAQQAVETEVKTEVAETIETKTTKTETIETKPETETVTVQSAEELIAKFGNKSNAIRALSAEGKTRSEIAKILGIRYQHVNNVLKQVLKRPIKAEREAAKNGEVTVVTDPKEIEAMGVTA